MATELLQNISCYSDGKREKKLKKEFDKFDELINYNFWWLCFAWSSFFPDIMVVYEEIISANEHFFPGAPANQRSYFKKLRYFGKKVNKKKR